MKILKIIQNFLERDYSKLVEKQKANHHYYLKQKVNKNWYLNLILFFLAIITTTWAGATFANALVIEISKEKDAFSSTIHYIGQVFKNYFNINVIVKGIPYSLFLMLILTSHEFGHFLTAVKHKVKATLPFFIPLPPIIFPFGTMGAIIKIKSGIPNRRALVRIGALGPIAGFLISVVAIIIGLFIMRDSGELVNLEKFSEISGGIIVFGESLLIKVLRLIIVGEIPIGFDYDTNLIYLAGWIGFLVTGLNLMPISQLDGGHVVYALFGKNQKIFAYGVLLFLIFSAFFFYGWVLWIILVVFLFKINHPETLDDSIELTIFDKIIGYSCIIIFALTFMPIPAKIV